MNLYNRLKDLREDMDKNQTQIAEIIGTSQSYYAQYENGKRQLPFDRVIKLAKYYEVSLDYIAGLTNDKKGLTKSQLSEDVSHLVKSYELLSEKRKGKLELFLQQLVEEQENENTQIKDVI
ncbi:MAG: helix-turn-helix transcriptional regulator [Ruminococcus sp.]|nr:helix-turn-helix transcriptional regulator [Ruminococcus sp.]